MTLEFSSVAEMRKSYAAGRARLMGLDRRVQVKATQPSVRLWGGTAPVDFYARDIEFIAQLAAAKHGTVVMAMLAPSRNRLDAAARQEAWFLIRTHTDKTLMEIAAFFNRDHTTIISGVQMHRRSLSRG